MRGQDTVTGGGPGEINARKKGATNAHAKQGHTHPRYIGITNPGIISAESPNPIVNHLVIMPDIEKRLEAFVRIGHCFIVFTGGVGEHSCTVRRRAVEALGFLGLAIDIAGNNAAHEDADITAAGARGRPLVITAREDLQIARAARRVLGTP